MGDRRNIELRGGWVGSDADTDPPIYLYTHWQASSVSDILAKALDRSRSRWNDSSYLFRVIAQDFFNAHGNDVTGAGLSTTETSPDWPNLVVNVLTQTVSQEQDEYGRMETLSVSFSDFIANPTPFNSDYDLIYADDDEDNE